MTQTSKDSGSGASSVLSVPKPLLPKQLYTPCPKGRLPFTTTAELKPIEDVVGQDRAVEAIRFSIGMTHDGYNLFVFGPEGTGKQSLTSRFLKTHAAEQPAPDDWCYVNNFSNPQKPRALCLPAGRANELRDDMDNLVEELISALPAVFEGDNYTSRKRALEEEISQRQEAAFSALQKKAKEREIILVRTPVGLAVTPTRDGEVLAPGEFEKLPKGEKAKRKADLEMLQTEMETLLHDIPKWDKEQRDRLRALNREVTEYAVGHLMDELEQKWRSENAVLVYLKDVRMDVVMHAADFLQTESKDAQLALFSSVHRGQSGQSSFRRYQVNVMVDNTPRIAGNALAGAPVLEEDHPTQPNLVGRIEHISQMGTLLTDFNLIKPGVLHAANGGYLVLDARKLLLQPFAWEALKRALSSKRIRIESPAESLGWVTTVSLEPEPIPLTLRVVLLGEPYLYYLLTYYDPDFRELFKVAADFSDRMNRTDDSALQYARLIAAHVREEGLRHLDNKAVARIIEHGARVADDSRKLTTHMNLVLDVLRESDYWAGQAKAEIITVQHVERAIDAKIYRSDRLRERIQEAMLDGTLVIETEGEVVGQVNGLSVIQLDDFSFGRPSRITCGTHMGKGDVIDIERQVELGGPLHTKGVMILAGYLSTRFGQNQPLALSATLTFEQSYGEIDGDSASSAELYALLSALSDMPLRQGLAVTGSVDQRGRVQAIGGVNEKIEGFFDIVNARGLSGDEGVLIPKSNVVHLMLRQDVIEAVKRKRFHIYPIETIEQGIALLTGQPTGELDAKGEYPVGTVYRAVARTLGGFAARARSFGSAPRSPEHTSINLQLPPPSTTRKR